MTELLHFPPSRPSGFSACKKAEAAVVNIVDQCKPQKKCGGAGDKEEAEKQLQILRP